MCHGWTIIVRAQRTQYLPVVLTRKEVGDVLPQLTGVPRIMSLLLYGSGHRDVSPTMIYTHVRAPWLESG